MPKFKDRTGERYGRLIVIKQVERSNERKGVRWLCKCNCGNEKIIFSDELSSGKSNSCGCLKYEVLHNMGFQFKKNNDRENQILHNQFRNSRFKKIGCNLTFEDFKKLSYGNCFYCGQEPIRIIKDNISENTIQINGIDRIDSNLIYSKENTVSCCKNCNTAKSVMKQEEFYKWIKKVYEFNNL